MVGLVHGQRDLHVGAFQLCEWNAAGNTSKGIQESYKGYFVM
jgi:hypothetical protein